MARTSSSRSRRAKTSGTSRQKSGPMALPLPGPTSTTSATASPFSRRIALYSSLIFLSFKPILGLLRPLTFRVLAVQQVVSLLRQRAGLFVGAAIARRAHGEVQGFGRARVVGLQVRPAHGLRA